MGLVVPVTQPIIHGVYKDYPAAMAGIPPGSMVTAVNGVAVTSRADVSTILNTTHPGTVLTLTVEKDSVRGITLYVIGMAGGYSRQEQWIYGSRIL